MTPDDLHDIYCKFLRSGHFADWFPHLSGIWSKDEAWFAEWIGKQRAEEWPEVIDE